MQENLHPCFAVGNRGYSQGPDAKHSAQLVIAQSPKAIEKHHRYEIPESSGYMLTAVTIP